jgi:hypothetical protein
MSQHFAIGDRVIVTNEQATGMPLGSVGTVVRAFAYAPEVCDVQFDGQKGIRAVMTSALAPAPPPNAPAPPTA